MTSKGAPMAMRYATDLGSGAPNHHNKPTTPNPPTMGSQFTIVFTEIAWRLDITKTPTARPIRMVRIPPTRGQRMEHSVTPVHINAPLRYANVHRRFRINEGLNQPSWKFSNVPQKAQTHETNTFSATAIHPATDARFIAISLRRALHVGIQCGARIAIVIRICSNCRQKGTNL